ncbi:hypothetical protein [Nostoc sp. UHCC 0252]|uniref:hypothetical protein n=1 Tax=Nostoc sp. UHCC 0252 TaxID=3110241 RepID=UPI002B1F0035|nr:hypothetical protein [Nostoc sp. UHCC 0252]MEA5600500.1 hypothetical protein [Nostoc sp. UHCC 0252]
MWFSVLSRLGLPYVRSHIASPFWAIVSGGCKAPSRSVSYPSPTLKQTTRSVDHRRREAIAQSQARQFDSLSFDDTTHEQENC